MVHSFLNKDAQIFKFKIGFKKCNVNLQVDRERRGGEGGGRGGMEGGGREGRGVRVRRVHQPPPGVIGDNMNPM